MKTNAAFNPKADVSRAKEPHIKKQASLLSNAISAANQNLNK
jgi:hypothetical protein